MSANPSVYEQLLTRLGEAHPQPRLAAMQRLTELLGDPQRTAPVVQIAGTNGKSSVSRIVEILLRVHGLRTGLFVSPHLERFNERIMLDGEPVSDEQLDQAWQELEPILAFVDAELTAAGELPVTFFEATTALAFAVFADAPVDVMVLEVGMGGAWDATNVADATVAVFVPIDLDHTSVLGKTRAEIARTKAGIIKPGSTVLSAAQADEALRELRKVAADRGVQLLLAGEAFGLTSANPAVGGQLISVRGTRGEYADIPLSLHGSHQAENAALAVVAVELLLADEHPLNAELLDDALSVVTSPGRFERVSSHPSLIVDAAHNPHGIAALVRTLHETFPEHEYGFVLGALDDKDVPGIVAALGADAQTFFATAPQSSRALSAEHLANVIRDTLPDAVVQERESIADAVESLRDWASGNENRIGVITGSIVLIGEVMAYAREQGWSK